MLKKVIILLVATVVSFSVVGCSKNNSSTSTSKEVVNNSKQENKKEEVENKLNTKTVDGLTLTINAKIEPIKGDRTKDNYGDDNGEYFAKGSDIVKASDYKNIVVEMDIKNDTNKSIKINPYNISAELQDGYELTANMSGKQEDQVQSNGKGKYKLSFVVKNDIKADKIKLSYLWVKNEDEFSKLMRDPNMNKLSQKEALEKYKDIFTEFKLETNIQ